MLSILETRKTNPAATALEARGYVRKHWVPSSDACLDVSIVWAAGTAIRDRDGKFLLPSFPLLYFGSTEPGSGKSTGLKLLESLANRGKRVIDPTAPSLLNALERDQNSIVLDEFDTLIGNGAGGRSMRSILLESYTAGGVISRGDKNSPSGTRDVDVHFPFAYGGMRHTIMTNQRLDALRTRTLILPCEKPRAGETAERLRPRHLEWGHALRDAFARWGRKHGPEIAQAAEFVELPDEIANRDAELWEPLYAVAQALGGDWPERMVRACLELTCDQPADDEDHEPDTPVGWLLRDMATVFASHGAERLPSRVIVAGLLNQPHSPWRRWLITDPSDVNVSGGKQLATMLATLGVEPRVLKIDGQAYRGYDRFELEAVGMPALEPAPATEQGEDLTDAVW